MDFKTFFEKKIMMSFFVSVTCICAAMALVGMTFETDTRFGYEAFLSPLIFGLLASIPTLVTYSKKELSVKQTAIRNLLHFVLLETVVLSVLYFGGMLTSVSMAISLGISILIIDLVVNLVLWINDKRIAKEFNSALKRLQSEHGAAE
ncbi:MAG: DUF3021 domain-containing protein [Clostridiales bacterium]|jgi:hypothetical protein|nr:DUF3021 domain-containing protein [Clostridiales bacterium]